jgi:hypothetical protein
MILVNEETEVTYIYVLSLSESYINKILLNNKFCPFFNNYNMKSYFNVYNEKDLKYIIKYGIYKYIVNVLTLYNLSINEDIFKKYDIIFIIENPYIKFMNNISSIKKLYSKNELNICEFLSSIPSQTHCYNIKHNYYYTYIFIINKNDITILDTHNNNVLFTEIHVKYKSIMEEIKRATIDNNNIFQNYTQEYLNLANKLYSDDFESFSYKKCETIEELLNYYIQ